MNKFLRSKFTIEEIGVAVKNMHPTKVSEEDGMPDLFYQQFWHIIGNDVSYFCLDVLNNGKSLSKINQTNIVLIPKQNKPMNMTHFRPINLCNVLLKIITKAIVHRLQMIMPHCIDEAQSAFVLGRLITKNVIVAFELLHSFRRKGSQNGSFTLKLDMSKVYDMVEWQLIADVMRKLGFYDG